MEDLTEVRRLLKRDLNKQLEEMKEERDKTIVDKDAISIQWRLIEETYEEIYKLDQEIRVEMMKNGTADDERNEEIDQARLLRKKFEKLRIEVDDILTLNNVTLTSTPSEAGGSTFGTDKGVRLPKLELRRFTGELMDWLGFWAQFEKIDSNPNLSGSDKFQYLLMALDEAPKAKELVSAFPPNSENYPEAVKALKKRFGNEGLLLQVYIRELLKLVISNVSSKQKLLFSTLYVKVNSHLRALNTLNLAQADPASWLYPLVESCLPDDILLDWNRRPTEESTLNTDGTRKTRLDSLLEYLGKEVEIRQRMELVREGFQSTDVGGGATRVIKRGISVSPGHGSQQYLSKRPRYFKPIPTLTGFQNVERKPGLCIFCGKRGHHAKDCYSAYRFSFEERKRKASENGLCFNCLGGHKGRCTANTNCPNCGGRHARNMCKQTEKRNNWSDRPQKHAPHLNPNQHQIKWKEPASDKVTQSNSNQLTNGQVALQTLKVMISDGKARKIVRAFLDSGSQRSYILRATAAEMNLNSFETEAVTHELFGGVRTERVLHQKFVINVGSVESEYTCEMEVRDQVNISRSLPGACSLNHQLWHELEKKSITLTDVGEASSAIEILIGADYYGLLLTGNVQHLEVGAVAVETKLGWTLIGETGKTKNFVKNWQEFRTTTMSASDYTITQLWDLDTIGVRDPFEVQTQDDAEMEAKTKFLHNLKRDKEGRYFVSLPWKDFHPALPTNKEVAMKRLESTLKKLKTLGLQEVYGKLFDEWETEGFIEEVGDSENSENVIHYIPHRAVVKPGSLTTPVRPVFDASCKIGKFPSLNDCLHKGGNYILLIPNVLLGFREKKIGFISDIRKAFQMIGVEAKDRDVMRFLWYQKDGEIKIYRHKRVMFGATCSPFILGAVLEHYLTHLDQHQEIGLKLLESLYVDNCASSASTYEEYKQFREVSSSLLMKCQMDLRMWMSNVDEFDDPSTHVVGVLGVQWDRKEDVLFVNVENISVPEKVTKRTVLSTAQKYFDPIGMTCPAVLPLKCLLQRTWVNKMKWDELLPDMEVFQFEKWMEEAKLLQQVRVPRQIAASKLEEGSWSLHTFTDASKIAYAGVVYLRSESEGAVTVQLLTAKARVAPVKAADQKAGQTTMTIPRLELMGCLVGARLCSNVKKALKLPVLPEYYWTDSTTALAWIRRNDCWGTFVGNRTTEINKLSKVENWHHVPGALNPADLPSRGCTPAQLLQSRWWEGPQWLYSGEKLPGEAMIIEFDEEAISKERSKSGVVNTTTLIMSVLNPEEKERQFSTYVRIMGWVQRFIFNLKQRLVKPQQATRKGELSMEELVEAEYAVIRDIQEEVFSGKGVDRLSGIEVFKREDGLLYVKTRSVMRKDLIYSTTPLLLSGEHPLVRQLILDCHRERCHAGVGYLLVKLRKKYWILKARKTIKSVLAKCIKCRKLNAKPVVTETAPLPLDRIADVEVFQNVGVDLAGPFYLRSTTEKKVWMVIFTCAVYRAVHLDLVDKLSTPSFIKCLGSFVERYGRPAVIYSDNGTNFRGADNLFGSLDWKAIQEQTECKRIIWKFNPPSGPWWGGWWERIIRTIKELLARTVGKGSLARVELEKVLKEIQNILNDRPLTYVSESLEDLEPLTPNSFLKRQGSYQFPEGQWTEGEKLRLRYKYLQTLQMELKLRFQKEYLSLLVSKGRKKPTRKLRVGELVVVGTELKKRQNWALGRILELYPSEKDGVVRVAKVKIPDGELIRAVQRLHPLEVDLEAQERHHMLTRTKK